MIKGAPVKSGLTFQNNISMDYPNSHKYKVLIFRRAPNLILLSRFFILIDALNPFKMLLNGVGRDLH
ncbi:hypothetical protein COK20_05420 [Bacillus cereus]|nr:hypothetical protein COK20_05420 [Bacillus cereus]PFW32651.1 hypothetical protein COL07_02780 [Bacillus cereus]